MAALSIAFEIGKNLKVVNSAELLSKWVGETSKNIEAIFQEARAQDSVLVFDEAEGLFGRRTSTSSSSDRYANIDVGVLLYHMERHPGEVILTTNNLDDLDPAFFRRIKFFVKFDMPSAAIRGQIWRATIPKETPLDPQVDFKSLGSKYELSGGSIKSAVIRAAARAAVRIPKQEVKNSEERPACVTMQDLLESAEEEIRKGDGNWGSSSVSSMYI
jgi:SpoVK/Ycf46/Vps4 family AAA+-type ATPase